MNHRTRAVRLLARFFANDDARARRTVFHAAFGDCERDPTGEIDFSGAVALFADHAVERLLAFGCADRGRHGLSLLLRTMAECRGRQTDPDYLDLPALLDQGCAQPTRAEEIAHLDALLAEHAAKARLYAPLRGSADLRPAADTALLLAPWQNDKDIALLLHRPRPRADRPEPQTRSYEDILTAFGEVKQAALLGAPGAGKSTTLRRLAADLALTARADVLAPLPLLVKLRDWHGDQDLAGFLAGNCPQIGWAVPALARARRLVLLFDGLNEVPTPWRKAKAADLLALKARLPLGTPFIVSCRRDDYVGDLAPGLDILSLEPLSPQRVRAVLHHWLPDGAEGIVPGSAERLFWQLAGHEQLAGVLATWLAAGSSEDAFWSVTDPRDDQQAFAKTSKAQDELWRSHAGNPRNLLRLASNPFMLTMLFAVWGREGVLPRNRGNLFNEFVRVLLSREGLLLREGERQDWPPSSEGERLLCGLSALAWTIQGERLGQHGEKEGGSGVLTVLPRAGALDALGGEPLLKRAEDATVLEGADEIRFRHQLLQEYFTATAMRQRIERDGLTAAALWPPARWWERNGWEESTVLLAGFYSDDCTPVIRWLIDAQPEVAAQCCLESGAEIAGRDALLKELHDAWLPRMTDLETHPEPEARAAIGRALGLLERNGRPLDDRKGVGLRPDGLPDIDWVECPGGEFIYQVGQRRQVETFRIGRYPVTNAQFRAFLDAQDGYADDRWWAGLDLPDRDAQPPRYAIANHPRETVSWFEAMAFCAWLANRLGLEVRLPTEWEWERTARGLNGREYPWGAGYQAGYANINETLGKVGPHALGRTSPVGIYPQGVSAEGVCDLSGNVWEWCLNEYSKPKRLQPGGSASRVMRGGSWRYGQHDARADGRGGGPPVYRNVNLGFRLLCVARPHSLTTEGLVAGH